jgi:murein L,D-transpeptidase YafK
MNKILLLIFVIALIGVVLYLYSDYTSQALIHKISGKRTVEGVVTEIESDVSKRLQQPLDEAGYSEHYPKKIIMVAYKEERLLQLYANNGDRVRLIKEYPFTAFSGNLGPKLREGDLQIPEGVYEVKFLNPNSAYHLSIKVGYPNEYDKAKSEFSNIEEMGGDIFIHGKSSTVGCIPIGDQAIEEVFLLTHKAISNFTKIIISPRNFILNPQYPQIDHISWDEELYDIIHAELKELQSKQI